MLLANPRAVYELPERITDIYQARSEAGLRELSGISKNLASEIRRWLGEMDVEPCKAHL
jgi:hypothetical protein